MEGKKKARAGRGVGVGGGGGSGGRRAGPGTPDLLQIPLK